MVREYAQLHELDFTTKLYCTKYETDSNVVMMAYHNKYEAPKYVLGDILKVTFYNNNQIEYKESKVIKITQEFTRTNLDTNYTLTFE